MHGDTSVCEDFEIRLGRKFGLGDTEKEESLHVPREGGNLGDKDTAGCGQIVRLGEEGEWIFV